MSFEDQIKKWVSLDDKIAELNENLKTLRNERKTLTDNITVLADSNGYKNSVIEINNSKLRFHKVKVAQSLSLRYVEECLTHFIDNKDDLDTIMDYIRNNKEAKYVEEIKRVHNKN